MQIKTVDIAIIGLGAAGIHLLVQLMNDDFFKEKQIVIFDEATKTTNDKTWSFWHKEDIYPSLIHKTWQKGQFFSKTKQIQFHLSPYKYSTIKSIDFYNYAHQLIQKHSNVSFINQAVLNLIETEVSVEINTGKQTIVANQVFDSRVPEEFEQKRESYPGVLQHFIGWEIETEQPTFDDSTFTMMDYRLTDQGSTNFMYVLPYSKTRALVEFTYFSPNLVKKETYEEYIKTYISDQLNVGDYRITETEYGVIPMSMFPFQKHTTNRIIKIGTGGGAVKPSSGYSFYNSYRIAKQIKEQLKKGDRITLSKISKHHFYDAIFLHVLQHNNAIGNELFSRFYERNNIRSIFQFLDEESSLATEVKIISTFITPKFLPLFLQSLLRYLF